ncbi:MAG: hypothetical protein V1690_02085 [Candidatus Moraniibacteriota bacterium]
MSKEQTPEIAKVIDFEERKKEIQEKKKKKEEGEASPQRPYVVKDVRSHLSKFAEENEEKAQRAELKKRFCETLEKFRINTPEQARDLFGIVVKDMIEDLENKEISPEGAERLLKIIRKILNNPEGDNRIIDITERMGKGEIDTKYGFQKNLKKQVGSDRFREIEKFLKSNKHRDPHILEFYRLYSPKLSDDDIVEILADSFFEDWEWNPELYESLIEEVIRRFRKDKNIDK